MNHNIEWIPGELSFIYLRQNLLLDKDLQIILIENMS